MSRSSTVARETGVKLSRRAKSYRKVVEVQKSTKGSRPRHYGGEYAHLDPTIRIALLKHDDNSDGYGADDESDDD